MAPPQVRGGAVFRPVDDVRGLVGGHGRGRSLLGRRGVENPYRQVHVSVHRQHRPPVALFRPGPWTTPAEDAAPQPGSALAPACRDLFSGPHQRTARTHLVFHPALLEQAGQRPHLRARPGHLGPLHLFVFIDHGRDGPADHRRLAFPHSLPPPGRLAHRRGPRPLGRQRRLHAESRPGRLRFHAHRFLLRRPVGRHQPFPIQAAGYRPHRPRHPDRRHQRRHHRPGRREPRPGAQSGRPADAGGFLRRRRPSPA